MPYFSRYLDERELRNRWIDPRLSSVRVAGIRNYLLGKKWQEVSPDRSGCLVFQEPDCAPNEPLYQFVPEFEQDRAYPALIHELIAALASIEDRYAGDVLTDILRCQAPAAANGADHQPAPAETVAR